MTVVFASLLAAALCYAGMAGLCLGMNRHYQQVWGRKSLHRQRALRLLGWLLLVVAIWPCVQTWGAAVGVVIWLGWLSAAGLLLVLLLPYRPKGAALLMGVAVLVSVPALVWSCG